MAAPIQASAAFRLKRVATLESPTSMTTAPGFPNLIFVTERPGRIRVVRDGHLVRKPFLDISTKVTHTAIDGLLGLAFPPDYRKTGRFYVHYTGTDNAIRIDEYHRSSPVNSKPSTRRGVMLIPQIGTGINHNGGQMRFRGNELYIAVGDGTDPGDPFNQAQDLTNLRGKILRIDPRVSRNGLPYSTPKSNPFSGATGRPEIFAYGLRNPFTFSFEQHAGRPPGMLIGDVGQQRFEEIDYMRLAGARGSNFGWKAWEGIEPYDCVEPGLCPNGGLPDPGGTVFPVLTYPHSEGCAVISGSVVRDPKLRSLRGRFLYGDYCAGRLRSFIPRLPGGATRDRPLDLKIPNGTVGFPALRGFGTDSKRRVYLFTGDGALYRLTEATPIG